MSDSPGVNAIDHADALDWLSERSESGATLVVFDPPYAVGTPVRGREDGAAGSVFGPLSLVALDFKRGDTIRWFAQNGHPTPPRSACWFCPNSEQARWQELKETHPDLFERACKLDEHIRQGGAFNARGNQPFAGKMFLHRSLIPLRVADLRTERQVLTDAGVQQLFDDEEIGMACSAESCFT